MSKLESPEARTKRLEYLREYRKTHPKPARPAGYKEARAAKARSDYATKVEVREAAKANAVKYRQKNPEKVKEQNQKWVSKNRDRVRAHSRNWNRNNKEAVAAIVQTWRAANPDAQAMHAARRRIKLESGPDELSQKFLQHLMVWQQGRCVFCGETLFRGSPGRQGNKTFEHFLPIEKGGFNTKSNVSWSCLHCNTSRQDKLIGIEWEPDSVDWSGVFLSCKTATKNLESKLESWEIRKISWVGSELEYLTNSSGIRVAILSSFAWSLPESPFGTLTALHAEFPDLLLYWDFEWETRPDAILNSLASKAGGCQIIGARKCEVKKLSPTESADFYNRWHVQGSMGASEHLGLIYGGALVAALSTGQGDLQRFCSLGRVVGGLSKLLKYSSAPRPLRTFCEPRHGTGKSYEKVGFKPLGFSDSPSYGYVSGAGFVSRYRMQRSTMPTALQCYIPDLTEAQNACINGLRKLEGLPQARFVLA